MIIGVGPGDIDPTEGVGVCVTVAVTAGSGVVDIVFVGIEILGVAEVTTGNGVVGIDDGLAIKIKLEFVTDGTGKGLEASRGADIKTQIVARNLFNILTYLKFNQKL